jgi:hypothetical protein
MRELNVYSAVKPPQPRPGQLSTDEVSPQGVCTPNDPMGFSRSGPYLHAPQVGERTAEQEQARRERSEAEFGDAIMWPVLEAASISSGMKEANVLVGVATFVKDVYNDGVELAGANHAMEQTVSIAVDALLRSKTVRWIKPVQKMAPLIKQTIIKAIKAGGGSAKEWYDKHSDSGRWTKDDNDTQAAVDRNEERQRNHPGTIVA